MTFATLDQTLPDESPLTLSPAKIPMSPDVASPLAGRISWSFEKPYIDVYNTLVNGNEDDLRSNLAAEETKTQTDDIASVLRRNSHTVTSNTLSYMSAPKSPTDIVEKKYAEKAVNSLIDYTTDDVDEPSTELKDAAREDPTGFADDLGTGKRVLARRQLLINGLMDAQSALKNQSYFGWGVDALKSLTQIYPEVKLRGNVPGVGAISGGLLGEQLEKERIGLWDLPDDQFNQVYLNKLNQLKQDNPSMAVAWAQAMYGQSLSDRFINNAWTAVGALDVKSGIVIGKGLAKLGIRRSAIRNVLDRGTDEMARGLDAVPPSVSVPESSGRIVDAALQQTVNRIQDQEATRITPERTAMEGLMSVMNGDRDLAIANTPERVQEVIAGMKRTLEFNAGSHDPEVISQMAALQTQLDEYTKANELAATQPHLAREIFNRLVEKYDNSSEAFMSTTLALQRVLRIGNVLANRKVLEQVWNEIKGRSMGLSDNVIDMSLPKPNRVTGNYEVSTIFGRNSAELFNNKEEAFNAVEHNGLRVVMVDGEKLEGVKPGESGVSIGNVGGKYYAMISRPIKEIEHYIRDGVVETAESKAGNHGFLNSLGLGWGRTPEEVLPSLENMNRKIAIYGPAAMREVLEEHMAKDVSAAKARLRGGSLQEVFKNLGKGSQFQRMLDDLQRSFNPETGKPGKFLDGPQDVYAYYMQNFKRAPDALEYDGYFAAKRGMAMDYAFRNMMEIKNAARAGNEEHRFNVIGKDGKVYSNWIVGAVIKPEGEIISKEPQREINPKIDRTIPATSNLEMEFKEVNLGGKTYTVAFGKGNKAVHRLNIPGDSIVAYTGDYEGEQLIKKADNFSMSAIGKDVIPKLQTGQYKLIKIWRTHEDPLNGFSGIGTDRVQYVITKNVETRPLSFDQIPRLPGFHLQYEHPWYLKQADIRRNTVDNTTYHWYEGDATAMLLQNRLMGEDVSKILNEVRNHLLNKRDVEAETTARALPIGWKELKSWFEPQRGPGGVLNRPRFNLTEDFKVIPKNGRILDIDNSLAQRYKDLNFRDGTKTGSPSRQFQVEFTGQRDAYDVMEMNNKGTRYNPQYSYDPAQPLDPITSMGRALSRVTNSLFMDDVKISSMENWLRRNKDFLDLKGLGDPELMSAPFYHFSEAKILKNVPKTKASQIEAERWMVQQFNGTPSVWDTTLAAMQDRFMDDIYGAGGWNTKYAAATVGKWGVSAIKDGPAYLRYMAFKAGLGMFSLPQFFVQANTFVTIAGVAGWDKAAQGGAAALMHTWSRFNKDPAILRTMDKKLQTFGWKPGEFLEANNAIKGTGFDFVSNETNTLFGYTKADSIFTSAGRSFLNMGDLPFKEGERMGRYGAWYTAFKEWRDKNPVGRLTELDRAGILQRADDLAGNMTLASKSGLQRGVLSFPTQFLGYSMRLTELALGHRLTWQQRARLFGTYWAAYGLPVAAGISGVTYFGDSWKDSIQKAGYNPDELSVASLVNEGLPAAFLKLVTGNTYNVGERYGNPGLDVIRDFFAKDKTVLETYAGASGSLLSGAWEGIDGYWKWVGSFFRGDDKQYGMTSADFIQPFKTFASVNNAWRTDMAASTGVWMSKNETPLKDNISVMDAIFMSSTGLQPKIVDTQSLNRLKEERNTLQKEGLNGFIKNVHRAMDAIKNKDPQLANVYFNNAKTEFVLSGYPDEKKNQAWNAALQVRTLPERELWNYWMQNVDPSDRVKSTNIYSDIMRNMKK